MPSLMQQHQQLQMPAPALDPVRLSAVVAGRSVHVSGCAALQALWEGYTGSAKDTADVEIYQVDL